MLRLRVRHITLARKESRYDRCHPRVAASFDVSGPRYTSYPTADRFVEAFGQDEYTLALQQRKLGTSAKALPLSLYVHIPFLQSRFATTARATKSSPNTMTVQRFIFAIWHGRLICTRPLRPWAGGENQLHFGGGTPTFLSDEGLRELMGMLRRSFSGAWWRVLDRGRSAHRHGQATGAVGGAGLQSLSFGVQDFDPEVQKAVHRIQPAEQVFDLVAAARRLGFESVNVDLIYGLPRQTPEGAFDRTLAQVAELRPDRIALYAYAHLPERFKAQRRIILRSCQVHRRK